jgi:hypothetical protein
MDLKSVRRKFVEETGRYHLVQEVGGDPWADNGANFHINRGQKFLDLLHTPRRLRNRSFVAHLAPGEYRVEVPDLRAVHEVWVSNADGRTHLEPMEPEELRAAFATDWTTTLRGCPQFYTIGNFGLAPGQRDVVEADHADETDTGDLFYGEDADIYDSVIVAPPPDLDATVRIVGLWWSPALTTDDSLSWWTVQHPDLVVWAAAYQVEVGMRNTSGAQDWYQAITERIRGLDYDDAEEVSGRFGRMEG